MFKSLSLFTLLLASASSVISQDTEGHKYLDIKTVCKQTPKLGLFGQLLEERPDIYAVYAGLKDKTFYLPSDDALNAYYAATGNIFRRAAADDISKASYQFVNGQNDLNDAREKKRVAQTTGDNKKVVLNASTPSSRRKRQLKLGNDTITTAGITVSTGLGEKSEILFGDIQCTQGLIQVVDTLFAVPVPPQQSLEYTGLTEFSKAVNASGYASKYDSMGNITMFAPQNDAFKNCSMDSESVQLHVVENKALYTPDLKDGSVLKSASGENLYVTVVDDVFYINCVKVIVTDSIVSNGVIHVVEKIIKPLSEPPSCWANTTVEPVKFTGSAPMNQAGNMLAIVGALAALFAFAI